MIQRLPVRSYYVNRPFKYMGIQFETGDVFPALELKCSTARLTTLANSRYLTVANVVTAEDHDKGIVRVNAALGHTPEHKKEQDRTEQDRQEETGQYEEEQEQEFDKYADAVEQEETPTYTGRRRRS